MAAITTSGSHATNNNGPDAYIERVLRDIDDRGQSHVARINREDGGAPPRAAGADRAVVRLPPH